MRKKLILVIIVVTILVVGLVPAFLLFQPKCEVKVGAYYYPWYMGTKYGYIVDEPLINWSNYWSNSTAVIDDHLDWFKDLRIDFLILSWWGLNGSSDGHDAANFTNECSQLVFKTVESRNDSIQLALMVEAFNKNSGEAYNFTWIYNYIYDNFVLPFPNQYMTLYGKPLLLFFNDDNLTKNGDIKPDVADRFETRIVGSQPYVQWGYNLPDKQQLYMDGYIFVEPRFDAYGKSYDPTWSEGLYDQQWNTAIDLARKGKVNYVAIITWNEYGERTQIEPSKDATYKQTEYFFMYNKTKVYINMIKSIQVSARSAEVGAYYYAWWGIGINNHWNDYIKGTPFLGYYNSSDPVITDKQILLAKQHGIDFFAVSWMGKGDWYPTWDFPIIDYNLRNGLLKANHIKGFNFCLFYETKLVLDSCPSHDQSFADVFANDMLYAAQQYFPSQSYLRVNGDPVLFIYNVPYLYEHMSAQDVTKLFDNVRQQLAAKGVDLYIIGDVGGEPSPADLNSTYLYSMNATTSYFFSDPRKGWNGVLEDARTYYPQWLSTMSSKGMAFVPNAYPGFNNTNNENVSPPWTVLPRNETEFKDMLEIALEHADSKLGIAMITSWNEWMEGTMIEPSMKEGELFLHVVYDTVIVPELSESAPNPSVWLLIGSGVLGAVIASGIVTFYFLKGKKKPQNY